MSLSGRRQPGIFIPAKTFAASHHRSDTHENVASKIREKIAFLEAELATNKTTVGFFPANREQYLKLLLKTNTLKGLLTEINLTPDDDCIRKTLMEFVEENNSQSGQWQIYSQDTIKKVSRELDKWIKENFSAFLPKAPHTTPETISMSA